MTDKLKKQLILNLPYLNVAALPSSLIPITAR